MIKIQKKIKQILKNIGVAFMLCLVVLFSALPIHADTVPTAPTPPSAPTSPTTITPSPTTTASNSNSTTPTPTPQSSTAPTPSPTTTQNTSSSTQTQTNNPQQNDPTWDPTAPVTPTPTPTPTTTNNTGSSAATAQTPNTNSSLGGGTNDPSNIDNGVNTSNTSSSSNTNTTSAIQTNTGSSIQTVTQGSTTGQNNASENVGDTNTTSGDANVSGTIITAQNTNVDGVAVSEFNIADNHTGDIVLDFGANCISGCSSTVPGEVVSNTSNGSGSTNNASSSTNNTSSNFQKNDGSVGNNLVLTADSGNNLSNKNTGGNTNVQTGNANVSANALTFLNNNIAGGNVVYGVVNIYGDLQGDIILPQSALDTFNPCPKGCNANGTSSANTGNGTGSTNDAATNQAANNFLSQTNDAVIDNNLQLSSTTGQNQATQNTGGTTTVQSGQASAATHVLNIANSNISGGNYWLVLINNAGQWIGKLLGAPDGATTASNGLTITTDSSGNVTASSNNGNGAGSTNNSQSSQNSQTTTQQNNTGKVNNNLKLSANTGGNTANDNTGGNVNIQTGDAKILTNIVNFVNNNIVGKGKLFVTIVNVFGKWVGDFVTPGQQKQAHNPQNSNTTTSTTNTQTNLPHPSPTVTPTNTNLTQTTNTENPVIQTQSGTPSQHVSGTVTNTFPQSNQKTTVEGIHANFLPTHPTIQINLAWILLTIPLLTASLLLSKTLRKK